MLRIKIFAAIFMVAMFSLITASALYAEDEVTSGELQEQIDQIEQEQEEAEEQLAADELEYDTLIEKSKQIQLDISETESEITETENEINSLEQEIDRLEDEIAQKQIEVDKLNEQASQSLVALQQIENKNLMVESLFGESESIGEVYNKSNSVQKLTQGITSTFNELLEVLNEIKVLKEETENTKVALEESKTQLESKKVALESQKAENETLSREIAARISDTNNKMAENEQSAQELQEQIDVLEAAGCGPDDVYGVDCAVPSSGGPAPAVSGFTRPTTNGWMSNPFGYSGYDVSGGGFHPAVDIAASCGTPLYASAPGTVISIRNDWDGYGHYLGIVHNINGKNYVSLYAHMQAIYVSVGQQVGYDTVLGELGTTGASTGCHVHFSINSGTTIASYSERYRFIDPNTLISFPAYYTWYYSRY